MDSEDGCGQDGVAPYGVVEDVDSAKQVDRSAAVLFGFGEGVVTGGLGGEAVVVEAPGLAAGPFDFGGVGGLGVGEAGFCRFELGCRSIESLLCVADLAIDGVGGKAAVAASAGGEGLAVFVEHYPAGDLGGSEFVEFGELTFKVSYGGQRFGRCGAIGDQRFGYRRLGLRFRVPDVGDCGEVAGFGVGYCLVVLLGSTLLELFVNEGREEGEEDDFADE